MLRETLSDVRYRLRALFGRDRLETELDEELRFHVDRETDRLVREGVSLTDARKGARLSLGAVERVKEESRDSRGVRWIENIVRDLGAAFRLAARQPGFSAVVALSLALGIGTTTAVFNLTYDVLFATLAVDHPEQLVNLARVERGGTGNRFSWAEYQTLRSGPAAGAFTTARGASAVLVDAGGQQRTYTNMTFVEGNYFGVLGVHALAGRLLTPDDDAQGRPVVVLAQWFAKRLFPDDSLPVGRTLTIRGAAFTVVGVTPRSFRGDDFPGTFELAIPEGAVTLLGANGAGRDNHGEPYGVQSSRLSPRRTYSVMARMTGPVDVSQRNLAATFARCCTKGDAAQGRLALVDMRRGIAGGKNDIRTQAGPALAILVGGMALVLMVVCCNVASLLLVRAAARQREFAVRLSLGASRARLAMQLFAESVPHALLGLAGGVVFAAWCTSLFVRSLPADMTDASDAGAILAFRPGLALGFAALLAVGCTMMFSLYPALRATRQRLAQALRLDARSSRTRGQGAVVRGIVVVQVAVTATLIVTAGLLASSLINLSGADPGMATDRMLFAGLETRSTRYETAGAVPIHDEVLRRVREVPGVRAASMTTNVPLFGGSNTCVAVGVPGFEASTERAPEVCVVGVTPEYFETVGMRLVAGRAFAAGDGANAEPVAIVSQAFAQRYYGTSGQGGQGSGGSGGSGSGGDRGGARVDRVLNISLGLGLRDQGYSHVRVVGVASDVKYETLRDQPTPVVYVPLVQVTEVSHLGQLVIRTEADPMRSARAVARAIDLAAPGIGVRRVQDMRYVLDTQTTFERLAARLAIFVSLMALSLSAVGLYGVVAYSVARRTGEIGVRIALGARSAAILWLVVREALVMVGLGLAVGLPLAFAANGALRSLLFGVGPRDPAAALGALLLMAMIGLAASVVPARRAIRIDPKSALGAD